MGQCVIAVFHHNGSLIISWRLLQSANPILPGLSNFDHLMSPGTLMADKTKYIEQLDASRQYQYMFLRPRTWGKSTFLQMLADYYDKSKDTQFHNKFGDLYIGKNPTPDRSSYLVLLFDFSSIQTVGSIEKSFHASLNWSLESFLIKNGRFLGDPVPGTLIMCGSCSASLRRVLVSV